MREFFGPYRSIRRLRTDIVRNWLEVEREGKSFLLLYFSSKPDAQLIAQFEYVLDGFAESDTGGIGGFGLPIEYFEDQEAGRCFLYNEDFLSCFECPLDMVPSLVPSYAARMFELLDSLHQCDRTVGFFAEGSILCAPQGTLFHDFSADGIIREDFGEFLQKNKRELPPEVSGGAEPSIASDIFALAFRLGLIDKKVRGATWYRDCTSVNPADRPATALDAAKIVDAFYSSEGRREPRVLTSYPSVPALLDSVARSSGCDGEPTEPTIDSLQGSSISSNGVEEQPQSGETGVEPGGFVLPFTPAGNEVGNEAGKGVAENSNSHRLHEAREVKPLNKSTREFDFSDLDEVSGRLAKAITIIAISTVVLSVAAGLTVYALVGSGGSAIERPTGSTQGK